MRGAATVVILIASIGLGSRGFRDYDVALLPYTIGVLFAAAAVVDRCSAWLQRPATRLYWVAGWRSLLAAPGLAHNLVFVAGAAATNLAGQRFILRRGRGRWFAHFCLAWGSMLAAAVTVPLVLGWLHFETRTDDAHWYRVVALGTVIDEFHTSSLVRAVTFNLLNVSAVMVIVGASLALFRRLRNREKQRFAHDVMPLLVLLGIAASGLLLTLSARVFHGYGYRFVAALHALLVIGTLLVLPFGKLFHIFQRPLQLAVALYRRRNAQAPARCRSCGDAFASARQVADLKRVLAEVGLPWEMPAPVHHYAEVCPRCRRRLFGFAQGRLMDRSRAASAAPALAPALVRS